MTAFLPSTDFFPPLPPPSTPKFYIGEHEPLPWLVSILFTDKFWQRDNLTQAKLGNGGPSLFVTPEYPSLSALYEAAEAWVKGDKTARACLAQAKEAIAKGELVYYAPKADEWGEKPYHTPERDVESFSFLTWAEGQGYPLGKDVCDAAHTALQIRVSREKYEKEQAYAYPAITAEDFERLKKHPLWSVAEAIIFAMGHRARREGKEINFAGQDEMFKRMLKYALDADQAGEIKIIGYEGLTTLDGRKVGEDMLKAKVKPDEFIRWAKGLPVTLAMLAGEPVKLQETTAPVTPELQLIAEAREHFWRDYPTTKAPLKKHVTAWLQENAPRYGIEKLSNNLAEAIDTIMRPPEERSGGLKSSGG